MTAQPPARGASPLDDEHLALMHRGVSITVATAGPGLQPNLTRAVGFRIDADRRRVTLFLARCDAADLLADLRDRPAVAVVFSEPSTHRTVQLKGFDAREVPLREGDDDLVAAYAKRLEADLASVGFGSAYGSALIAHEPGERVGVAFTVAAAFNQTPGPSAGAPLAPAATPLAPPAAPD